MNAADSRTEKALQTLRAIEAAVRKDVSAGNDTRVEVVRDRTRNAVAIFCAQEIARGRP